MLHPKISKISVDSTALKLSSFKMGWILAMFDLPVITKKERKIATKFRKFLLDDGYMMVNYSVYARPCINWEQMRKHASRLEIEVPEAGNVRTLFITDKQWKDAIVVIGKDYQESHTQKSPKMPHQLEFWE
jgi:CRISPR-associated protein Cas2